MRTATRILSVGLCLGASVPLAVAPAIAATTGPSASTSLTAKVLMATWFWNKAVDAPAPLPVGLPPTELPPGVPSGFPASDLVVGSKGDPSGNPDKETYLSFDLHQLNARSVIDTFTFNFTIDSSNLTNVQSGEVPLEACLPTRTWEAAPDGGSWVNKPADDCSAPALGTFNATKKAYTFEVSSIMQNSIGGQNLGVAIREPMSYTNPFQIAFTGARTITATVTFHQLPPDVPTPVAVVPVVPPTLGGSAPATVGSVIGGEIGAVLGAQPATVPTVANPTPLIGHELTPATSLAPFGGDTRLGRNFWLASALGVLGVLAIGLVLGQRPKVALAVASGTRLSAVLAARAAALAAAAPLARRGTTLG